MNWLAHVFLSEPEIECRLGNLLADPGLCRILPGPAVSRGKVVPGLQMRFQIKKKQLAELHRT